MRPSRILYILIGLVWMGEGRSGHMGPKLTGYRRTACPPSDSNPEPVLRVDSTDVLQRFRAEMTKSTSRAEKFDAYLIPGSDAHQSLIVADRDKRILFMSGFTGDKALAIINQEKAAIWVDPYDVELADQEIDCNWIIYTKTKTDVSVSFWIQMNLRARGRVGVDPTLLSQEQWDALSKRVSLVSVRVNLVDSIWTSRPPYPHYDVKILNNGNQPWISKINAIREVIRNESCDTLIVTALDEISWLLNLRGRETEYLPVIRGYMVITDKIVYLYTNVTKLGYNARGHLKADDCFSASCVRLIPYENIWGDVKTLSSQIWRKILFPGEAPFVPGGSKALFDIIQADKIVKVSPVALMKAVKNEEERTGMANAQLRDAAAFCDFMAYFERMTKDWDEHTAGMALNDFRRSQELSQGISFKTVVAFGAHSALPHYDTNNITSLRINSSSILLIDSGGQYQDGTTDLARTFHLGKPTDEHVQAYTRVLMGLIDLASASFPESLTLQEADVLARRPLWDEGMDYSHPTGHGIGCISVEEGPLLISQEDHPRHRFKEGYFVTDGPGFYEDGLYGIRLKNVLEVVPHTKNQNESGHRLFTFRSATLVPFEPKLIDRKLLSPKQVSWLNEYNARIREDVGAELKRQNRMPGFHWMLQRVPVIPDSRCSCTQTLFSSALLIIVLLCSLSGVFMS